MLDAVREFTRHTSWYQIVRSNEWLALGYSRCGDTACGRDSPHETATYVGACPLVGRPAIEAAHADALHLAHLIRHSISSSAFYLLTHAPRYGWAWAVHSKRGARAGGLTKHVVYRFAVSCYSSYLQTLAECLFRFIAQHSC